ncbi:hypothetical protein [Alteraurantiacibacter palmitatis]|uniref:Uncharacterized protein n=1 Tax=Alteraurantiacibacter palmitatis TaxID=2054628 RepID=A0ABV7E9C4_9SPHN
MPPFRRLALAPLAPLLALAACGDGAAPVTEAGSSSGEVLPGSISDAMLPIDSTRSEPPLIEDTPTAPATGPAGAAPAQAPEDMSEAEPESAAD